MIHLATLAPQELEAWDILLDLAEQDVVSWTLVGGQMMYTIATEFGVTLPRTTPDMDVVVDVRVRPDATEWISAWLEEREIELESVSTDHLCREALNGQGRSCRECS